MATLKSNSEKIVAVYAPKLNTDKLYDDARDYLLSQEHKKDLETRDNEVYLYDANNIKIIGYRLDYGVVRKIFDKYAE